MTDQAAGPCGSDSSDLLSLVTEREIEEWTDAFILEKAYNRPVAIQIATKAAQWVAEKAEVRVAVLEQELAQLGYTFKDGLLYPPTDARWQHIARAAGLEA